MLDQDTIAAVATSAGEAGIGIIRVSGDQAVDVVSQLFRPTKEGALGERGSFRLRHGWIVDPSSGSRMDEVLVSVMRQPRSYTGEDVVEINAHGGSVVLGQILRLCLAHGARLAEPGEFTKRAFLNGRLDLSQAEAVMDVIRAKTNLSLQVATDQLKGHLKGKLEHLRGKLYDQIAQIEATIDFPEDVADVEEDVLMEELRTVLTEVEALLATADEGKIMREGLKMVIVGKPNVGKSSLLNRLLRENRALVTEIPGTTRDVIEEVCNLQGIPVRIVDTAGIRKATDPIERMGVQRSYKALEEADLILVVLDVGSSLTDEDRKILQRTENQCRIIAINKTDLEPQWTQPDLQLPKDSVVIQMSLEEGQLEPLIEAIVKFARDPESAGIRSDRDGQVVVTHQRHQRLIDLARQDLLAAMDTVQQGLPIDFVAVDITSALEHLGEITGETVREDIIEQIFSKFCIGK